MTISRDIKIPATKKGKEQKGMWFHIKSRNLTVNLNHVSEIYWDRTILKEQPYTQLVFGESTGEFENFDHPTTNITDASDRIALRKLIVGDDWIP